jgi:hypothetical protein
MRHFIYLVLEPITQNGVSERAIRTMMKKGRSIMYHVHLHWPDYFEVDLWPYALNYTIWLHNHIPYADHGCAPMELYCRTKFNQIYLQYVKVWECPTCVLNPKLQDGKKIPKWESHSRLDQFLGFGDNHSSLVGLVRNVHTEYMSPQFHAVYHERFTSINNPQDDNQNWIEIL